MVAQLLLEVVEAKKITSGGRSAGSDAFVKLYFRGDAFKTNVCFSSRNPKWKCRFLLDLPKPSDGGDESSLLFMKLKHFAPLDKNSMLAYLVLDLDNPQSIPEDKWYPFTSGKGELRLRLKVTEDAAAAPVDEEAERGATAAAAFTFSTAQEWSDSEEPAGDTVLFNLTDSLPKLPTSQTPQPHVVKAPTPAAYAPPAQPYKIYAPKPAAAAKPAIHAVVPGQQECHPVGTATAVQSLMALFPQYDFRTILGVLKKNNYSKEKAIDELMDALQTVAATSAESQKLFSTAVLGVFGEVEETFVDFQNQHKPPRLGPSAHLNNSATPAQLCDSPDNMMTATGRRKALLIGINYLGSPHELRGCIQDVTRVKKLMTQVYGFSDSTQSMLVLTDDNPNKHYRPTKKNMLYAFKWLMRKAAPGDVLFFHFSGHGSQSPDKEGDEADGMDETILPSDWATEGPIIDDTLSELLVLPLPSGVKLTSIMDCCHSGTGMDLPFNWNFQTNKWEEEFRPILSCGDVTLISGCRSDQTSADLQGKDWGAGGALSLAILTILSSNPHGYTYPRLMKRIHKLLDKRGFKQRPQLSTTQQFDLNTREFNFNDILLNMNPYKGREGQGGRRRREVVTAGDSQSVRVYARDVGLTTTYVMEPADSTDDAFVGTISGTAILAGGD